MPRPHIHALALLSAFLVPSAANAQAAAAQYGEPVRLEQAKALVALARAEAGSRGLAMAFAVALPSGDPILLEVMDGTQFASTAIAPAKARTAARFRRPTKVLQEAAAAGNVAYAGADGALALEGGVPILSGGKVIGALGVSGGTFTQDGEVAMAALQAFSRR